MTMTAYRLAIVETLDIKWIEEIPTVKLTLI